MDRGASRYALVSRRAMLKGSAAAGLALVLPACGNDDVEVFAGALTDLIPTPTPAPTVAAVATTEPIVADPGAVTKEDLVEPTPEPVPAPSSTATVAPTPPASVTTAPIAVAGEMIISFTYTQGVGGKNERPYIAVWIEDDAGELVDTVSLWYQQQRRGERWLDHLDRWWAVDQDRIMAGGADDAATISSATRAAGSHVVVWDGGVDGAPVPAGQYFVCIEAARENGPYSLIREPLALSGTLAETLLAADEELSNASVRIDV